MVIIKPYRLRLGHASTTLSWWGPPASRPASLCVATLVEQSNSAALSNADHVKPATRAGWLADSRLAGIDLPTCHCLASDFMQANPLKH